MNETQEPTTNATPRDEEKEQQKTRQQKLIERAIKSLAHVHIHPNIDFHDETGLTFGVVIKDNGKHEKAEEERPVIIMDKEVTMGIFEKDKTEAPISTGISVSKPDFFYMSNRTEYILLLLIKDIQNHAEIEKLPKNEVYNSIRNQARLCLFHPDTRIHIFLASWIIATYLFPMFRVFPNLVLQGERESGKSTACDLATLLAWNPTESSSGLRAAPLFRTVENSRPTVIIDLTKVDIKNLEIADMFEVIDRSGTVPRCVGDEHKPKYFHIYSPRAFAVRNSVSFSDKSIEIITVRTKETSYTKYKDTMYCNKTLLSLPDQILRSVVCNWREVYKTYLELEQDEVLQRRRFELWRPFLAVCKVYAPEDYEQLLNYAHEDTQRTEKGDLLTSVENVLVGVLLDQFPDKTKMKTISLKALTTWVQNVLTKEVVRNWRIVQSAVKNLRMHRREYNTSDGVQYEMDGSLIEKVAKERMIHQFKPPTENEVQCNRCHANVDKTQTEKYVFDENGKVLCMSCHVLKEFFRKQGSVKSDSDKIESSD